MLLEGSSWSPGPNGAANPEAPGLDGVEAPVVVAAAVGCDLFAAGDADAAAAVVGVGVGGD